MNNKSRINMNDAIDWAKSAGYMFAAFLGINFNIMVAWLGLMILDALIGAISYQVLGGFSWKELRKGIFAKFLVVIIPISFSLVVKTSGNLSDWIGYGVSGIIFAFSLGDGVSIMYHYLSIRTGKRVKAKQDFILGTINFIIEKFKAVFSAITKP